MLRLFLGLYVSITLSSNKHYDRPVEDTDLRTAVARAGFTVAGIEQMEA